MQDRIYGLETEYGLRHHSDNSDKFLNESQIFSLLEKAIETEYLTQTGFDDVSHNINFKEGKFIENGARFYYDTGHAEWATPECRSASDAVIHDKAGEKVLQEMLSVAESKMRAEGYSGNLHVIKNNIDQKGSTYGCHENYLISNIVDLLRSKDHLNFLVTFLTTRQIFCGSGKVGLPEDKISASKPSFYQISQRADYTFKITSDFTLRTPDTRAIVDARDEPLSDGHKYKRLHLILGDSNLSEWSNFLKLGITGLILQMIEDNEITTKFLLADPIAAIREISCDPQCEVKLELRRGASLTAVEIQRNYLEIANRYFEKKKPSAEQSFILKKWDEVLSALANDPMSLSGKLDWVIKKSLLEQYINKQASSWDEVSAWFFVIGKSNQVVRNKNEDQISDIKSFIHETLPKQFALLQEYMDIRKLDWKDYWKQLKIYYRLKEIDIQYHDLNIDKGLYFLLQRKNMIAQLFDPASIESGMKKPPQDTRARIRGNFIKKYCNLDIKIQVDWNKIKVRNSKKVIELNDPFIYSDEDFDKLKKRVFSNKLDMLTKWIDF